MHAFKESTNFSAGPPAQASRLGRIIFAVIALTTMCGLSGMLATRLYVLKPAQFRSMTFQRILTILTYFNGILFIFAASLFLSGWQFNTYHICRGSMELCLAFYVLAKVLVYLFLLERASSIRGIKRLKDPYWMAGAGIILFGFGTIAILAFIGPLVLVSKSPDHDCQIGLPVKALITLLSYDTVVNVGLTILYLFMANKICHRLTWRNVFTLLLHALPFRNPGPLPHQGDVFELFMAKSVLACFGVILATVGNLVALIAFNGHEEAWVCLAVCILDVSWAIVVIHWLTSNVFRCSVQSTLAANPRAHELAGEYSEFH